MITYELTQLDALGDPTRRAILDRLLRGPLPVGEIAREFPVSRPAISQHLGILKKARLVLDRPVGNRRLYELNPEGFEALRQYLDQFWSQALAAFQLKAEETARGGDMSAMVESDVPVRKSIRVNASAAHAFHVFTEGFDAWWPRSHHIGSSPMKRAVIEGKVGGRCYSEQVDGTDCPWGSVLAWDPPHRLVLAWQINAEWKFEPDLSKSSEVEIRFTPEPDGTTRVDLEHRHFDRMGPAGRTMATMVDSPGGWSDLLKMFADHIEQAPKGEDA